MQMDTTPEQPPRPPDDLEAPDVDALEQQLPPAGEPADEGPSLGFQRVSVPDEAPEADVLEQSQPAGLGDEDDWPRVDDVDES